MGGEKEPAFRFAEVEGTSAQSVGQQPETLRRGVPRQRSEGAIRRRETLRLRSCERSQRELQLRGPFCGSGLFLPEQFAGGGCQTLRCAIHGKRADALRTRPEAQRPDLDPLAGGSHLVQNLFELPSEPFVAADGTITAEEHAPLMTPHSPKCRNCRRLSPPL